MENKLWLQASCIFYIILKSIKRAIFLPQERRGELRLLFLCLWTREGEDQGSELAGINRGKSLSHVQLFATLGLNTGVGSLSLLQGIFPTQGSNLGLLHCGWILYQLSHRGSPEKEMATHSSVLAWRIPGTGEPGGLSSVGSHRIRHDWSNLAVAAAVEGRGPWDPQCKTQNLISAKGDSTHPTISSRSLPSGFAPVEPLKISVND